MMDYHPYKLDHAVQRQLYRLLLLPRMIEEKMISLLRQGKVSKWFSGIGQEAISVGCTAALMDDELIFTLHRNLGVYTTRQVPMDRLFAQWQGKKTGFTKGRDRSFHFGAPEYHIVGMISHLGPQLSLAAGSALAYKLKSLKKLSLVFTGEGGTSEGEFHEALNVASVWELPVIFVIENNGYGLSTTVQEQYRCESLADRAQGYGMNSKILDGNNILEVYQAIREIARDIRETPRPWFIECRTFRMRGHEEASGIKYVPENLLEEWALRDPIENFENHIISNGIFNTEQAEAIKAEIATNIQRDWTISDTQTEVKAELTRELDDVYHPTTFIHVPGKQDSQPEIRFIDAIHGALDTAMEKHSDLVLMGQDIAEYGGVFKVTEGLADKYGKDRVRNTPLCESAIIGAALGLSLEGIKSMVEMQFADFVSCGFNQIVNNLAKIHYRWGQAADVVIRMPTGAGVGAGPFHSQSTEAWFTHTPGLKVVYPCTPFDAKGLLLSSFEDPNPVLYFEHKALYRTIRGGVPKEYYNIPIGQARIAREGMSLSVITYGLGVHWALEIVDRLALDAEILDLRSLVPLDYEAIDKTVRKTSKILILHEDTMFGGLGGEISAYISENLFEYLDAPIIRVASLDTPVPFAKALEDQFLAKSRLEDALLKLHKY